MTVSYTYDVSDARFWGFPRLLLRWKGSIYRLMYREMIFYLTFYYLFAYFYRTASPQYQREFERIANYCQGFTSVVPITFVLGFYVTLIVGRWWQQYVAIPWPDKIAIQVSAYVQGDDERGRIIRRAMVRYVNQISVLTFKCTSTNVKTRFPTLEHLVTAGIMTENEKVTLENVKTHNGIWWIPAQWFGQLAMVARKEGRIHDDLHLKSLMDEMLVFRAHCGTIWSYDWISVPLVYTQVVTIAVYSFFVACLFGRQYLYHPDRDTSTPPLNDIDYYVPVFTIFQFFFYVGWLKVAEAMICPFGKDDDDFDVNWIIDRNLQVGYLIVDKMYKGLPELTRDLFWDNVEPEIPYTQASASSKKSTYFGSTQAMNISSREAEWDIREHETLEPIDEEMSPGEPIATNSRRSRLIKNSKKTKSFDSLDDASIRSNCSMEDDERSNGSRQVEEKRKRQGLGGLIPGFSRSTLFSKFGSKISINSSRNSVILPIFLTKKTKNSPPPGSFSRQFSIPGLARSRLSTMKASTCSSQQSCEQIDDLDDTLKNMEDFTFNESSNNLFPPRDNFTSSAAQIDVPPVVQEEPEPDVDTSGSGSDTSSSPKKTKPRTSFSESIVNFQSSQTPLISPDN